MPVFHSFFFKRFIPLVLLSTASATVFAHCDGFCTGQTDTPWEVTKFSGLSSVVLLLTPFSASNETTENNKLVYSAQEKEAALLYLASDGEHEDVYFTAALSRFRQETPESKLSDFAVAALISYQ